MGQTQSDEGESPRDDNDVDGQSKKKTTAVATNAADGKQKSNNQRAYKSTAAATRGHDSKQQGRYKRNLLAATNARGGGRDTDEAHSSKMTQLEQQHVRKLSNVSNRNIQLLSMKPRNERDNFADGLRSRRRSSLINLILGAPSRGPRFSDDLCSLSSHMSELCNFGIDYFPDTYQNYQQHYEYGYPINRTTSSIAGSSLSRLDDNLGSVTLRPSSLALPAAKSRSQAHHHYGAAGEFGPPRPPSLVASRDTSPQGAGDGHRQHRRRSSFGSLSSFSGGARAIVSAEAKNVSDTPTAEDEAQDCSTALGQQQSEGAHKSRRPSLASIFLASIDLSGPLAGEGDGDDETAPSAATNKNCARGRAPPLARAKQTTVSESSDSGCSQDSPKSASAVVVVASTNDGGDNHHFGSRIPIPKDKAVSRTAAVAAAVATAALAEPQPGAGKGRINHNARRIIHRSGSELSLYSCASAASLSHNQLYYHHHQQKQLALARHTSSSQGSLGAAVILEAGGGGGRRIVSRKVSTISAASHRSSSSSSARQAAVMANSGSGGDGGGGGGGGGNDQSTKRLHHETKWIIMLQVCLPFILAGFGNMAAGLVLNTMAQWEAFQRVPIFFVLLPSFVGLKGNIEMTLASRLSTLSNLSLLDTGYQRRHAFATNLLLILSQAIGLSLFAAFTSVLCEFLMGKLELELGEIVKLSALVVLPCALVTSVSLVLVSSIVVWLSIGLARRLQVNPDNLSTLVAALYGDVSCVLTYGLFARLMYSYHQRGELVWPAAILASALISWPLLWYAAYKSKETRDLSMSSMPPMLTAIVVSLGSGAVLSLVVGRFSRIALFQPVVNGFGANLIAVQASRVSTWLWCNALRRHLSIRPSAALAANKTGFEFEPSHKMATAAGPYGSLASFATGSEIFMSKTSTSIKDSVGLPIYTSAVEIGQPPGEGKQTAATRLKDGLLFAMKLIKLLLWSFCNSSPNSVAARLLLVMLIPAHSLYFIVIWLLSPPGYVVLTWLFYLAYIGLCLTQVFVLLLICEPLMTFLMSRHLDPDAFGISLLMALADLIGTLCLTGAFFLLASLHDPNA